MQTKGTHLKKKLWFAMCCCVAMTVPHVGAAPAGDAKDERATAAKAEQAGDWDVALLHYETVHDSTVSGVHSDVCSTTFRRTFAWLLTSHGDSGNLGVGAVSSASRNGDVPVAISG